MRNDVKLRKSLMYTFIFLLILIPGVWIAVRNSEQINELKAQGKDYNIGFATVSPQNGESAYDIAKRNGFEGTEKEWLLSLIGIAGESIKGDPGLNAYQLAVINGYTGSQAEWVASLKGPKGDTGQNGQNGESITGASGKDGTDGVNGQNGTNGQPPTSWRFTYLNTEYECKRTDPFDPASPTYTCDEYIPPVTEPNVPEGE